MKRWLALFLGLLLLGPLHAAQGAFEEGVAAYRAGDYGLARERWEALLAEPLEPQGRARVYHDLGNAYWRMNEPLRAIACYGAAVRLDPRHADAWQNLELARAKANLPPADAGDLAATLERLLTQLRADERRTLLLFALLGWTVVLMLEVRLGGRALRAALLLATLILALAALPWARGLLAHSRTAPLVVVAAGGVPLRGEPLESRAVLGELATLEEVERLDELPGWVRIERADGLRGWAKAEAFFALRLAAPTDAD